MEIRAEQTAESKVPDRVWHMRKAWGDSDAARDKGLTEPEDVEKFRNLSYGPYGTYNLLDIYRPKCEGPLPLLPVIINVHGGGYFYGDKELYRFYAMLLAQSGFAVINGNYRLSPEYSFPDPLEDIAAMWSFAENHAGVYGLDMDHVFMVGDSAGAQLVSQFAAIAANPDYRSLFGFTLPVKRRLCGISLACGTYHLRPENRKEDTMMLKDYIKDRSLFQDPRTEVEEYIGDQYPPVFIFSAPNDFLYGYCPLFAESLRARGIRVCEKIYGTVEDAEVGHVFHMNLRLPQGQMANRDQIAFFKELLAKEGIS